jgi:16S rRNA (cytosine967-C5)-methyltransferase
LDRSPLRARPAGEVRGLPARRAAVRILARVLTGNAPLDRAIGDSLAEGDMARLDERDRALAHRIVAATLRRLAQIDAVLASFLRTPIDERAGAVAIILRSAAAQLLFLDMPVHAVVNIAVALAGAERGGRAMRPLVNAVLRRLAREGPQIVAGQDAAAMVLPEWIERRWTGTYGADETRAIAALMLDEPPLDLSLAAGEDAADWARRLGGACPVPGTVRLTRPGHVPALEGYEAGAWWVQDAAAAIAPRVLGDVRASHVIDLCAAPGGKTAALASAGARVIAVDHDRHRMERLNANLERLGLAADEVVADAAAWRPPAPADAVLLDAPCSATGVMRRHPDILRRRRPGDIGPLAELQAKILAASVDMVRPGGLVVYSVCSLEPEEGEHRVDRLLRDDPRVRRWPIPPANVPGFAGSILPGGDMRVLPTALGHQGGNDGFYIALLKKMATNQDRGC